MESVPSLARHLANAATRWPEGLAMHGTERQWTFMAWLAEVAALAATIDASRHPLIATGSSLDLARYAFACALKNRPFQPVDRAAQDAAKPVPVRGLPVGCNHPPIPDRPLPDGIAVVISTSGSEGAPRRVMLSAANLDAAAAASNRHLPLAAGDLWLDCLPLYHIGGLSIVWRCARAGAAVLLHEGFHAEAVAADLQRHPITHLSLVPAMLALLLETGVAPPARLRHLLVGGAALSQSLYDKATAAGWPLNPSYGMSETAAQVATWTPADGPWHQGLVGRPLGDNEFALAADGRIRIRGPQVMAGYLDGSGVDANGWLTTGDLGEIDAKGRLTVTGRADDMLISGGRNVHPLEVESCLAACPGIRDVAVTGLADKVWGDLVVALVVGDATAQGIADWCRPRLPGAAQPRRIVHLANLPRNAAGKLERSLLRQLAREAYP
jgi:O-succinylbenzoic acid--CoA ligase